MESKKSLLSNWLEKKRNKGTGELKKAENGTFPLSPNQESLYFFWRLYPYNPVYNYHDVTEIVGDLDLIALEKAFQSIPVKHAIFRTKFGFSSVSGPFQTVTEQAQELEIKRLDCSDELSAKAAVITESVRSFDLEEGHLLRLVLIVLPDRCWINVIAHHIVIDKWSMMILRTELANAYRQAKTRSLDVMKLSEPDFAMYARKKALKKPVQVDLVYWINKLKGGPFATSIPLDKPRPRLPQFKGKFVSGRSDILTNQLLESFANRRGTTPFVVFLSAFFLLLRKYSGQNKINVGVPFTDKSTSALEKVIGFFDETLVMQGNLKSSLTFSDFVDQINETVLEAFDHKEVPLNHLVKELNPPRIEGVNPLFNVMFIYFKQGELPDFGMGTEARILTIDIGITKFDITLFSGEDEQGFYHIFEYDTSLFDEERITRMMSDYQWLLKQLLRNPDVYTEQVGFHHQEKELKNLVSSANAWKPKLATDVLDQIQLQVKLNSEFNAVADSAQQITYSELWSWSDKVAKVIHDQVAKDQKIIGLKMNRNVRMIVAMVGVLKTGKAYLPLDSDYPKTRLAYMIRDAGVKRVIAEDNDPMEFDEGIETISFPDQEENSHLPSPWEQVEPVDLAYLIYTSGSTGQPKGVGVTRFNLATSTSARLHYYPKRPDAFFLFSSFSFDSSVAGIYWTLCGGGKLVIGEQRVEQDIDQLNSLFDRHQISHTLLLPSLYQQLLKTISPKALTHLKAVIVAGEGCTPELSVEHYQKLPEVTLYNEYGPTETTVWSTVYHLPSRLNGFISIGKAIPGTFVVILDENQNAMPKGVPGEICIGGHGVTPGYVGTKDNTKFLNWRYGDQQTVRLYRTGDKGMIQMDDNIRFLGRMDQQVKIRGYRIELGEIESRLNSHPEIEEGVIRVVQNESSISDTDELFNRFEEIDPELMEKLLTTVEGFTDEEINYLKKS